MISLRLAIPAVLTAAAVAGCFTYFVQQPIAGVVGDPPMPPAKLT